MEVKKYAPVIIPTLNRYEHFKRCLESLEKCTGSQYTEVYVGIDYPPSEKYKEGWEKICEYLASKEKEHCFKKLHVIKRAKNCGVGHPRSNGNLLVSLIKENYESYIFTEDDNEFSPCFLDFMNKAIVKYKDNPKVFSVSGYNQAEFQVSTSDVIFVYDNSAWGQARWLNKEKPEANYLYKVLKKPSNVIKLWKAYPILLKLSLSLIRRNKFYGDASHTVMCICEDKYQVRPSLSLARNWGNDGSGLHSGVSQKFSKQIISDKCFFEFPDVDVTRTYQLDKAVYENMMPQTCKKRMKIHFKILIDVLLMYSRILADNITNKQHANEQ